MSWRAQGMRTWFLQRLTALYMLLYIVFFSLYLSQHPVSDYPSWRAVFANLYINIATIFLFFSILYHAWVGIRDILIDYVQFAALRFVLWIAITFALIALAVWVVMLLYSVVVI